MQKEYLNMIGKKFNRLTVLKRLQNDKYGHSRWLCKCDCGNYTEALAVQLRGNRKKSCGCLSQEIKMQKKEKRYTDYSLYWRLARIKTRCKNPNNPRYKDYGGRGIKICEEWLDKEKGFENFYNWAIANGYEEGLTIDRIDVNGNYEPSNCRWVTPKIQSNNKRNNIMVEYNNKKITLKQWSELLNLNYKMVYFYYKKGIKLNDIPMNIEKNKINRSVVMCNKNTGKEIRTFNCINEVIKKLNLNKNQRNSIYACLKGRQKSGLGYKWRYKDE